MIKPILHLSTDFQYQNLYPNLVKGLNVGGVEQLVFIQHRGARDVKQKYSYLGAYTKVSYGYSWWMKFFFGARILKIFSDLKNSDLLEKHPIIMAYFLMTDGAVAYLANKTFGTPYIVSVRNTDISHYLKYRPWLKSLARKILMGAETVIFVSPSYIAAIKEHLGAGFYETYVAAKVAIIGNIVNDLWFDLPVNINMPDNRLKLIYVGEFSKNKRIEETIKAFVILKQKIDVSLTLVGNYGDNCEAIAKLSSKHSEIVIHDKLCDPLALISLVDQHDIFVMPSKSETFGMVYVEAMARGLPIVYTKGQGIDGYFPDGSVGYSVSNPIAKNIADRVIDIVNNYVDISSAARASSHLFLRSSIIEKYLKVFKSVGERL